MHKLPKARALAQLQFATLAHWHTCALALTTLARLHACTRSHAPAARLRGLKQQNDKNKAPNTATHAEKRNEAHMKTTHTKKGRAKKVQNIVLAIAALVACATLLTLPANLPTLPKLTATTQSTLPKLTTATQSTPPTLTTATRSTNPNQAFADEATEAALSDAQRQVEETAATYNDLSYQVEYLEQQISENQERIDEIQRELPNQRKASNNSLVAMYKMQQEGSSLLDMLLGSGSITEFLEKLEYLNRIQGKNLEEINKLASMEEELTQTYNSLSAAHSDVEKQRTEAQSALEAAQAARSAAQLAAEQKKQEEAQAAAAAAAAEAEAQKSQQSQQPPADANTGSNVATQSQDSSIEKQVSADRADWGEDKKAFVNTWAGRINSYLSGSPLSGQGETFASAAWDFGVDPRWSPAISYVESSKGAVCFLDHNAWGWGSSSWDSWEEAINDHVRGLSRGYGYTLSMEAAKKYCPPNWQHWYNSCAEQMDMI